MTFIKKLVVIACALSAVACTDNDKTAQVPEPQNIEANLVNLHRDIKTLASDEFMGRGPLTEGETLTINYLEDAYKGIGLKGGNHGSFFQKVPMAMIKPDLSMQLTVGDYVFEAGKDFTARTQQISKEIVLDDSELVFVGYGINAPEYNWNDYANVDVKDKTVIVLVNDPGFATQDDNLFTGNAMTYYGRWTYKYEEAARQGAKGVLIVHETAPAAYPWGVVENSNTAAKYTLVDDNENRSKLPIMGWIQQEVAEKIFQLSGLSYEPLKQQALAKDFSAIALNQSANLTLKNTIKKEVSNNVVALLEGSKYPNEYIILSAHWDHFGVQDLPQGRQILNGAVDNATGTAGTVELARMLKARHEIEPFERSIIFVNFTAEETGLLGSEYFSLGESVAMKDVVAVLNIDGMNVHQKIDYALQYGNKMSEMEHYLAKYAAKQERKVKLDPRPQNGLYFRSDHFSFAKQGVPSLLFMSLGDTDPDYIKYHYHKETDIYHDTWSLAGVKQDLELIYAITSDLAMSRDWPKWISDSDFKKRRAQDGK